MIDEDTGVSLGGITHFITCETLALTLIKKNKAMSKAQQIYKKLESLMVGTEFIAVGVHAIMYQDDWVPLKMNMRVYTSQGHCVEVSCEDIDTENEFTFHSDLFLGFKEISEDDFYSLIKNIGIQCIF